MNPDKLSRPFELHRGTPVKYSRGPPSHNVSGSVLLEVMFEITSAGVASENCALYKAAAPVTWGATILAPIYSLTRTILD